MLNVDFLYFLLKTQLLQLTYPVREFTTSLMKPVKSLPLKTMMGHVINSQRLPTGVDITWI